MALPKKKTSSSKTKTRFAQYANNRKKKLMRTVDSLKHIDRPIIFDNDRPVVVKEEKKTKKTEKKLKLEKVEEIKLEKKDDKKTTTVKDKKDKIEKTEKTEDKKKTENKKDDKNFFSGLFNKKNKGESSLADLDSKKTRKK